MNIHKLVEDIKDDRIIKETEVRTKIVYPLLKLLNYKPNYITDEFPIYGKEGRNDLPTKHVDIMIFAKQNANNHTSRKNVDIDWVRNNSLIAIELKKPSENISTAKEQATFYAMWARSLIYIITNGKDIEIYQLNDFTADSLLFSGKVLELEQSWQSINNILYFPNLRARKIKPVLKNTDTTIYSEVWEDVSFDIERDITDAIKGNKLFPYNVKSCPELPIIENLKNNLEYTNYCIIKGVSGCGKSITAYQLGYFYSKNGYKIYRYKNNDADEFNYDLKNLVDDKSVFIIDDFQNLKNISIDKIIANTSEDLKFICTITDDITIEAESTYLSSSESIKKIKDYYLKNRKIIYDIVHKIDKNVCDTYPSETIESRLEKAEKEATSPWMFNYILRGGWNTAKNDYFQAKDNNRVDLLLIYIALNQIAFLDKPISINEIEKVLEFTDYDRTWLSNGLNYLVKNNIIVEEYGCYRCLHIRYASIIISKMSYDLPKNEKKIIIKIIHKIIYDGKATLQGISWLLNEFRTHDLLFYKDNLINNEIWELIKKRCFISTTEVDIRNSCFVLEATFRFNYLAKQEIINEKIMDICNWINNISYTTGFALSHLINDLLDYDDKGNTNNRLFRDNIDFKKIANIINKSDYKNIGAIGYFLERLFVFEDDDWKNDIASNVNIESIVNNINIQKYEVDIWYLSHFITSLYYLDNNKGLILYNKLEEIFKINFKRDAIEAYEAIDNRLLWRMFGFSPFNDKRPFKKNIKKVKNLLNCIDTKKLANKICTSSNHDWERYARLINLINIVDNKITEKILNDMDMDLFNNNLNNYWEELPREMRIILYELAYGTENNEIIRNIISRNIDKIIIAEPVLTYLYPEVVNHCIKNNYKIDIFGFDDSFENALDMLKIIEEKYPQHLEKAILPSKSKIIKAIESIVPMQGFDNKSIVDFLDYIHNKNKTIVKEIFKNLNIDKTTKSLTRYNKEKKKNRNANITLATICKYIIKYNKNLESFANEILDKISNKYK